MLEDGAAAGATLDALLCQTPKRAQKPVSSRTIVNVLAFGAVGDGITAMNRTEDSE